jgi:hypothetical protein
MTKAEASKKAKEFADSLNKARLAKDKVAMNRIKKEVKKVGLVWEVNQATSKQLNKIVNDHTRELRRASKEKDIAKINEMLPLANDYLGFCGLSLQAQINSTKEDPGNIVY